MKGVGWRRNLGGGQRCQQREPAGPGSLIILVPWAGPDKQGSLMSSYTAGAVPL